MYMHTHMYMYKYVYMYMFTYMWMHMHMYMHLYMYMYVHVYMYTLQTNRVLQTNVNHRTQQQKPEHRTGNDIGQGTCNCNGLLAFQETINNCRSISMKQWITSTEQKIKLNGTGTWMRWSIDLRLPEFIETVNLIQWSNEFNSTEQWMHLIETVIPVMWFRRRCCVFQ